MKQAGLPARQTELIKKESGRAIDDHLMRIFMKKTSQPSAKYLTLNETTAHFCVSQTTIRDGRGDFGRLRKVSPTPHRTLVLRKSVEELDEWLERQAKAPLDVVTKLSERQRKQHSARL